MAKFFDRLEDAPEINQPLAQGSVVLVFCGSKVLMEMRSDGGQWGFPGGKADEGETSIMCAARELEEETGLAGLVLKFVGLFDNPGSIAAYDDGNVMQTHMSVFRAHVEDVPKLTLSAESLALRFVPKDELKQLDLAPSHYPVMKLAVKLLSKDQI